MRPSHIQARFDGAESIRAGRTGQKLAEAREVRIASGIARGAGRVEVIAFPVRVPKFNKRATNRVSTAVEDTSADVTDNARRERQVVIELDKVVIFVERNVAGQRVIRPLRHGRRGRERLGKITRQSESG